MTDAEKICHYNFMKGKFNKNACYLCRKIAKNKCKILGLVNNDKEK